MSFEKNKALARRYQEEVWGKGNLALIDELVAADFVDHSLPTGMDPGFAGAKTAVQGALDAFPDGQWTVEDLIAEGDKVVIRWKMQATHDEFRGIAPVGKPVTVAGITILRIANGKIAERWVNWDSLALRQPAEKVSLGAV
jgi:predicted ester cyclase